MTRYPFLVSNPVPLSTRVEKLREIEASQRFTNFGPVNDRLQQRVVDELFDGRGGCIAVANATLGLMIAIRDGTMRFEREPRRRLAIVPSFTFAATAHAAMWCNYQPLFCDVDPDTWLPDELHIEALLKQYGERVAVLLPYATFGNSLDLGRYDALAAKWDVPVVVDAAASLGSKDAEGRQFGSGSKHPVVYSMHATKSFAAHEGGIVYSEDLELLGRLRQMSNFGFDANRIVTLPGMNAKLSEVAALSAAEKLSEFGNVVEHRRELVETYHRNLPMLQWQRPAGTALAYQFCPARVNGPGRNDLVDAMAARGVELRAYFDPPLHRQEFFADRSIVPDLPVTNALSRNVISLPVHDLMSVEDAKAIARELRDVVATLNIDPAGAAD
ncbi:MAG TPA: DegT/DnrJ/EryC1/StrS family aminotransferase [Thermoanaerobaculia bacterium]|nr:DegT/DnrJ/EryC1/StrS family aminotransferase [Thermoanaerobaculia bacterium]